MSQILVVTRYEFLKFFKGKKLFGMIIFAYAVPILLISLPKILGGEYPHSINEFVASQMSFVSLVIVISVSFFGSSSIVSEFHNKTAYSLFPNPINRTSIWFGKFLAASLVSFAISSICYKVIAIGTIIEYNKIPAEILYSWGLSFVVVLMVTSISFLFSTILKGPTGAAVAVFILFILIFPMVEGLLTVFSEIKPLWMPSFLTKVIEYSVYTPYPLDLKPGELPKGPFDQQRFVPHVDQSIAIMAAYTIAASAASIFIFNRKEMT